MISKLYYFLTNQCNKECLYCFVDKGNDVLSNDDIDNSVKYLPENPYSEIVIYGGEPTLYANKLVYLVDFLQKHYRYNITLYSNGYDLDVLKFLYKKDIQIFINKDAYDRNLDDIIDYDWIFTIAPSNLNTVCDEYTVFNTFNKYPDFKIMHYYRPEAQYWSDESVKQFYSVIDELYDEYKHILLTTSNNLMPYFIKDSINKLLLNSVNNKVKHDCSNYVTIMPNGMHKKCYLCNHTNIKPKCDCSIKKICSMNTPCFADIPQEKQKHLCSIQKYIFDKTYQMHMELKDELIWSYVIINTYRQGFTNGYM